jgi:hypothetical protein
VPALDAAYSILAIENVVCAAILGQDRVDAGHRRRPATCLLATRAITNASQDWSPDDLEFYFAAAARCQGALIRHFASPSNLRPLPDIREVRSLTECPENCLPKNDERPDRKSTSRQRNFPQTRWHCRRLRPRPYCEPDQTLSVGERLCGSSQYARFWPKVPKFCGAASRQLSPVVTLTHPGMQPVARCIPLDPAERPPHGRQRARGSCSEQLRAERHCLRCKQCGLIVQATIAYRVDRHDGDPRKSWFGEPGAHCKQQPSRFFETVRPTRADFLQIGARRGASDRENRMRRKSEIREVIQGPFGVILPSIPAAKICCLRFSEIRGSLPSSRLDARGTYRDRHDT